MFQGESYTFDSKLEQSHFTALTHRLKRGEIQNLTLQPEYILQEGFTLYSNKTKSGKTKIPTAKYVSDFSYIKDDKKITVDVKGFKTPVYSLKRKLFLSKMKEFGVDEFHEVFKDKTERYFN